MTQEAQTPKTSKTEPVSRAFQDYYPDNFSYCYGCGRLNDRGLQIKSYWDGEESVCNFLPRSYHMAIPSFVYGGLIASLIDCHGTGTAAAAAYRLEGRPMDSLPVHRFVTASLQVDYLRPTPLGVPLQLRGQVKEAKWANDEQDGQKRVRKVIVSITLSARNEVCARGEVVAVQVPAQWVPEG